MDAFLNDSPSKYVFKYTVPDVTGGNYRYTPIIKAGQFGFYAQDKWDVADNFSLTYGLRFDIPSLFNDPTVNHEFNEYAASKILRKSRRNARRQSDGISPSGIPLVYGR